VKYRVDYQKRTGWKYRVCWDLASDSLASNSFIFLYTGFIRGDPADFRLSLAAPSVALYPGCAFNYIRGNRKRTLGIEIKLVCEVPQCLFASSTHF